ncbi:ATP-binding protein [Massilia sp. H6]|uniref:hybrid sensor histidine kinase/response regulator n=1 Tax=Massilia sp. H6 TaxID=2970464 RepID=UPI002166F7DD|nr:ATP-binding protein [Massilia sp. H6]UVW29275.1 ATP-binding protein [Massilia sp. H6]
MIPFELVAIFTQLQAPDSRIQGAAALAAYCGAHQVLLFGKDSEIGVFLPATGLPQTLREGRRWQSFLRECEQKGLAGALMPAPGVGEIMAFGMTDSAAQATIVFLGKRPHPDQCEQIRALLPLLAAKLAVERMAFAADGHAAAARESSKRAGALNVALDVNRRELQEAYRLAERELASRREAESKLRDADRRKDEFLAMLAHELRNPLAPISMAAQILKMGPADPARLQQTGAIIDRQVLHMSRLLDDLLDVSRVTRGMVVLSQDLHDMRAIVGQAVEQARPLIDAREHLLTVDMPDGEVPVFGDGTRLVQIVTNLLNNAAKYTELKGNIELTLALRGDELVLAVSDNGIGIDPALQAHVFELFTQGERASDRSQGGLGLGLALVRSLVERHGGAVQVSSPGPGPRMGSTFTVVLPLARPAVAETDDLSIKDVSQARALDILVVDDNEDAARTLALFLEAHGHRVRVAFRGAAALAMAGVDAPQVMLLDIGLPDIDGRELARRMRAQNASGNCTYIALTGYGRLEDRASSRAAGFDYHLTKPVNPVELAQLLGSLP